MGFHEKRRDECRLFRCHECRLEVGVEQADFGQQQAGGPQTGTRLRRCGLVFVENLGQFGILRHRGGAAFDFVRQLFQPASHLIGAFLVRLLYSRERSPDLGGEIRLVALLLDETGRAKFQEDFPTRHPGVDAAVVSDEQIEFRLFRLGLLFADDIDVVDDRRDVLVDLQLDSGEHFFCAAGMLAILMSPVARRFARLSSIVCI
ncbi:hypothetical protein ACWEKR_22600 [Nocardia sp. NPDC004573]